MINIESIGSVMEIVAGVATALGVLLALGDMAIRSYQRKKENEKQQATKVSSWFENNHNKEKIPKDTRYVWRSVSLRNNSESPVYNTIVTCVGFQGAGPALKGEDNGKAYPCRICVGVLPPGLWFAFLPTHGSGMHVITVTEIAFTDTNGISWVRRGNGKLEKLECNPVGFYDLDLPLSWTGCGQVN